MYNFLIKNGQMVALAIGATVMAIYLLIVIGGQEAFAAAGEPKNSDLFNFGLQASIVLIILTFLVWFGFGILRTLTNPKAAMKGILSIVALIAIFLIAYSMAQPETTGKIAETIQKFNISDGVSKYISGAIMTTGILGALAVGAIVISEIRNVFK